MFKKIDEVFVCENCGRVVDKLGYTSRDHCPYCLYSKHVDKNPGDRAEECKGLLKPIAIENSTKKGYSIVYKCIVCGKERKNIAAKDDDFDLILKIARESSFRKE